MFELHVCIVIRDFELHREFCAMQFCGIILYRMKLNLCNNCIPDYIL